MAHAYWRLNIAGVDGGSSLTIAEVEMRTTVGGANAATGGTASAESGTPANAFDGSTATVWTLAVGNSGWLQYHFASPVDIVEHAITAPSASMTNTPNRWSIQYSDDGLNWTSAAQVASQSSWGASEQRVFTHSSYSVNIAKESPVGHNIVLNSQTIPAASTRVASYREAQPQNGPSLSGTVKQNGTPVARVVRAYCRLTGERLGETTSDPTTGAFSINAKGRTDYCYVIAFDDLGVAPDYNAAIYDLVLPV